MAAPTSGRGASGSDSESGSSAEDWERFREAAWDPAGQRAATGRPEPSSGRRLDTDLAGLFLSHVVGSGRASLP